MMINRRDFANIFSFKSQIKATLITETLEACGDNLFISNKKHELTLTCHVTFFYGVILTGSECKRDGEQHCLNSTRPPIRPPNGWLMDQIFISSSCKTTASCATRTERLNGWLGALGSSEKVKFNSDYSAFTTHTLKSQLRRWQTFCEMCM